MNNPVSVLLRALALALAAAGSMHAKAYDKTMTVAGVEVHFKVVLPKDYDAAKPYPAVLAFPPGGQGPDMVMTTLSRNWQPEAERRGYLVFIPAAPGGQLFFESGARVFPEFIDRLLAEYKVKGGKFHIAGMSNGGISAFFIAAKYPQYFLTLTGFPGYLPDATAESVKALSKICIYMHAGELDTGWASEMQQQSDRFRAEGMKVKFTIEKGEGHVMSTLQGAGAARLFDQIESCGKNASGL